MLFDLTPHYHTHIHLRPPCPSIAILPLQLQAYEARLAAARQRVELSNLGGAPRSTMVWPRPGRARSDDAGGGYASGPGGRAGQGSGVEEDVDGPDAGAVAGQLCREKMQELLGAGVAEDLRGGGGAGLRAGQGGGEGEGKGVEKAGKETDAGGGRYGTPPARPRWPPPALSPAELAARLERLREAEKRVRQGEERVRAREAAIAEAQAALEVELDKSRRRRRQEEISMEVAKAQAVEAGRRRDEERRLAEARRQQAEAQEAADRIREAQKRREHGAARARRQQEEHSLELREQHEMRHSEALARHERESGREARSERIHSHSAWREAELGNLRFEQAVERREASLADRRAQGRKLAEKVDQEVRRRRDLEAAERAREEEEDRRRGTRPPKEPSLWYFPCKGVP
jgi:hypothetical protein